MESRSAGRDSRLRIRATRNAVLLFPPVCASTDDAHPDARAAFRSPIDRHAEAACFDLASTITMSSVAARTRTGPVLPAGGVGDVTVAVYLAPLLPPVEEPPHR